MISRVVREFQIDLSIQALSQHPTLESLSKIVSRCVEQTADSITDILSQVEGLSEEDAQRLLDKD